MSLKRQNALIEKFENEPILCPVCRKTHTRTEARIASAEKPRIKFVCAETGVPLHHGLELFGGAQFWSVSVADSEEMDRLESLNAELLEALKKAYVHLPDNIVVDEIRKVITKAEGK